MSTLVRRLRVEHLSFSLLPFFSPSTLDRAHKKVDTWAHKHKTVLLWKPVHCSEITRNHKMTRGILVCLHLCPMFTSLFELTTMHPSDEEQLLPKGFVWPGIARETRTGKMLCTVEPVIVMVTFVYKCSLSVTIQYINHRFTNTRHQNNHTSSCSERLNGSSTTDASCEVGRAEKGTQEEASLFVLLWLVLLTVPGTVAILVLGSYSDEAGRRKVLVPCLLGMAFRILITMFVVDLRWPLPLLLLGVVLEAITGGLGTIYTSCFAHLSDRFPNKVHRTFRFVILETCTGLTAGVANLCTLVMVNEINYYYPNLVLIIILAVCTAYCYFYVPETVARPCESRRLCQVKHVTASFKLFFTRAPGRRTLVVCLLISSLSVLGKIGFQEIVTYYLLNADIFLWSAMDVSCFLFVSSLITYCGSLLFSKLFLLARMQLGWLVVLASASSCLHILVTAFAGSAWLLYFGMCSTPARVASF